MSDQLPAPKEVLDRIQKLLNLAARNSNEAESAAATIKVNELLVQYNLDTAAVERASGIVDGKREELKVQGGFYQYQRDLWQAVAELHFCLYWTQEYDTKRDKGITRRGIHYPAGSWVTRKQHRLVGRIVNTTATRTLAGYLEASIERALRERLHETSTRWSQPVTVDHTSEIWGRWGISFREGAVARMVEKVTDRRAELLSKEHKQRAASEKAARAANRDGVSTAAALTLSTFIDAETDANNDFVHGAGWSARQAMKRAEYAREKAEIDAAHAAWAKANPEEAAKREEERRKQRRSYSYGRAERVKYIDQGAYYSGYDVADKIGLDPQVDKTAKQRKLA